MAAPAAAAAAVTAAGKAGAKAEPGGGRVVTREAAAAAVLAEAVYKLGKAPAGELRAAVAALQRQCPCRPPLALRLLLPEASPAAAATSIAGASKNQYLVAEDERCLFVCFRGTQDLADLWADGRAVMAAVWPEGGLEAAPPGDRLHKSLAHAGFLGRARSAPLGFLLWEARRRGKRLVLCGHSLGGAAAALAAVLLLQRWSPGGGGEGTPSMPLPISCVTFCAPPIGNEHLNALIAERFAGAFLHFLVPEDGVPGYLLVAGREPGDGPRGKEGKEAGPKAGLLRRGGSKLTKWVGAYRLPHYSTFLVDAEGGLERFEGGALAGVRLADLARDVLSRGRQLHFTAHRVFTVRERLNLALAAEARPRQGVCGWLRSKL